jgi:hypothetical protein
VWVTESLLTKARYVPAAIFNVVGEGPVAVSETEEVSMYADPSEGNAKAAITPTRATSTISSQLRLAMMALLSVSPVQ